MVSTPYPTVNGVRVSGFNVKVIVILNNSHQINNKPINKWSSTDVNTTTTTATTTLINATTNSFTSTRQTAQTISGKKQTNISCGEPSWNHSVEVRLKYESNIYLSFMTAEDAYLIVCV